MGGSILFPVHGETGLVGATVSGIAVNIAVRVADLAGASQVFASRTVRDLTIGAGFSFESLGERATKGAPGAWEILAVTRS